VCTGARDLQMSCAWVSLDNCKNLLFCAFSAKRKDLRSGGNMPVVVRVSEWLMSSVGN
jgi:hypothetical protein